MRAGFIINCPTFRGGQIFTNDNLTDDVAEEYINRFPKNADLFAVSEDAPETPKKSKGKGGNKAKKQEKTAEKPAETENKPTTGTAEGEAVNNTSDAERPTTGENPQK